jgi:hypothetical protein
MILDQIPNIFPDHSKSQVVIAIQIESPPLAPLSSSYDNLQLERLQLWQGPAPRLGLSPSVQRDHTSRRTALGGLERRQPDMATGGQLD